MKYSNNSYISGAPTNPLVSPAIFVKMVHIDYVKTCVFVVN
jgi:hypothetical protein